MMQIASSKQFHYVQLFIVCSKSAVVLDCLTLEVKKKTVQVRGEGNVAFVVYD